MSTTIDYQIGELLEQAGARIRGRNRADCPQCERFRAISFTPETFFCHGCGWTGNVITLMRELGIEDERTDAERKADRQARERAHDAALRLHKAVQGRRGVLLSKLRQTYSLEAGAHEAGPSEASWGVLATVYRERPAIEGELDTLESCSAAEILCYGDRYQRSDQAFDFRLHDFPEGRQLHERGWGDPRHGLPVGGHPDH